MCRTGLPPSLNDPYGSDSDSEPEDEEDEDSNGINSLCLHFSGQLSDPASSAEDWYKNDYPEEEESDADDSEYGSGTLGLRGSSNSVPRLINR